MPQPNDLTGRSATVRFTVTKQDLATAVGSGDVPVLATPRMIAWLEAATVAAVDGALPEGSTTVGTAIEVDHVAASAVGVVVIASATVRRADGRTIAFDCEAVATDEAGRTTMIGQGSVTRAIVNREKFLARLG